METEGMGIEISALSDGLHISNEPTRANFELLIKEFKSTTNGNSRRDLLAKLLETKDPHAEEFLIEVIADREQNSFIRREAARLAPGIANSTSIAALADILSQNEENGLVQQAITSLAEIRTREAFFALFRNLDTRDRVVRARLCKEMANFPAVLHEDDMASVKERFETFATNDADGKVRKASVTALASLPGVHVPFLLRRFDAETDDGIKHRILEILARSKQSGALEYLISICSTADRQVIRKSAQENIESFAIESRLEASINFVLKANWNGTLYVRELCLAVTGNDNRVREQFADAAIVASAEASDRVVSALATILIESCGGSRERAGERINALCKSAQDIKKYDRIRIHVGGSESLEPIFGELKRNLEENFSKPIADLNQRTIASWERTIHYVQIGFIVRLTMSGIVFLVGLFLTLWSVYRFSQEPSSAASLWGPGASLAAGMASMLYIAYSGPIKDIQASVNDIGKANAIFIGFVHSILQSSHTFSSRYLKNNLQLSDAVDINELVQRSMANAVGALEKIPYDKKQRMIGRRREPDSKLDNK